MEVQTAEQIAQEREQLAESYMKERVKAVDAETELLSYLIPRISSLREERKNLGIEMAYILLAEENENAKDALFRMKKHTAKYKGLERIIKAKEGRISLAQSIWKAER